MLPYILGITKRGNKGIKSGQVLGTTNWGKRDYK